MLFRAFYGKKNPIVPAEIPNNGNVSDEDDHLSDDDVESETEEEIIESVTESETENSSSEESEEVDVNITNAATTSKKTVPPRPKKKQDLSWTMTNQNWVRPHASNITDEPLKLHDPVELNKYSPPLDFFDLFCDEEFFQHLVFETNRYNVQRSTNGFPTAVNGSNKKKRTSFKLLRPVSIEEMKCFFGIALYMGVQKLPNRRMYWNPFAQVPAISTSMTRNRFEEILSILHFNDNSTTVPATAPDHNKLHKIQPVIDFFRS